MSEIKQLLKEAKNELARGDYEEAIEISQKVLKLEKRNYFALVFLGKAYSSNSEQFDLKKACEYYIRGVKIDKDLTLAWKGLFLLFNNHIADILPTILPYKEYFELCYDYMVVLQSQELSQVELLDSLKSLKILFKEKTAFLREFYSYFRPGTPAYETLGKNLITPVEALTGLIKIVKKEESEKISKIVSQQRMKMSANDPNYQFKINALAWEVYENSNLDNDYNQLVNLVDDDLERRSVESEWLEYRIKVLKSMPNDIKSEYFEKVSNMVSDMILVNHDSLVAWKYYFDWQDFQSLDDIDPKIVLQFFAKYPGEPLAIILYAWINSVFSAYDMKSLDKDMNQSKTKSDHHESEREALENDENASEEENELNSLLEVEEDSSGIMKEEDILLSFVDNIGKIKNSIMAYRIVSHYYLLNKEYIASLPYIKSGITLISYNQRDLGANLRNSKHELTIDIATCYTYVDAPKNHQSALSLFDKILSEDPHNVRSMIGKSIISIEKQDWKSAYDLLSEVVEQVPSNLEVQSQLAWCKAHLHEIDESLELFTTVINKIEGGDNRTMEFKSETLWRQAKTYLLRQEESGSDTDLQHVQIAFKLLIQIIKNCSDTFAKSYSTLGDIYATYFKDTNRAFKCYYKAFELDSSDIVAAKFVTEVYCDSTDWESASEICGRLIKEENATNILRKVNWPYRVMGISFIEKQMAAESIEWFQSAIRVESQDTESWVGLGQAYLECGRVDASIKVFEKVLELDEKHVFGRYFYSKALSEIGEFENSIPILNGLCIEVQEQEAIRILLADQLVSYAYDLYDEGYLMKSSSVTIEAIESIKIAICNLGCFTQNVWVILSKAIYLFSLVESKIDDLPIENLVEIFQKTELKNTEDIDSVDNVNIDKLLSEENPDNVSITTQFLILSAKYAVSSTSFEQLAATVKSACWHNIGITELITFITLKESRFRDAAIVALKKAIHYQSNNIETWVALGLVTMDINYRVSQHCFIKAVALSPKDINIWFNLAILGLKNNDISFASEVISRTQSLEPQNSSPWLGLALIKETEGASKESHSLFTHSFVLSNGRSKISQLLYAKSVLDMRIGKGDDERDIDALEEFTAMIFGLEQYFKKNPNNPYAIQCALVALERLHNFKKAQHLCTRLMDILEKHFEISQDDTELFNFAILKSQIARIQIGAGEYEQAIENATLAENILYQSMETVSPDATGFESLLSNHVCLGLAYFFLDDFNETLNQFQKLLELSKESRSLVSLLSKVLYDVGTDDSKTIALQELMEYTSSHNFDIMTTLLISAMTFIQNKEADLKIALNHLLGLSLYDLTQDRHKDIPYLIKEFMKKLQDNKRGERNGKLHVDYYSQRIAFLFPQNNESWATIDKKIQQRIAAEGQNKITAGQLSDLYYQKGNLRNIQKSVYLCPWNKEAIVSIKECF
ncbi:similar to Saccharomyces cerevisiae YPR189W SKI3 Ski complex component and TPR protein, mediates 3'-5' RNA degradation by the cytoplasmic exosome [Maudiozyma saulgeensis]|uniref:Similar to Saccharomyces cerevisiae YPR189W SKI3 Ski complex component and TPR protein, mediates 3'-5' RNA degradation by the cytoplasmic exosome n=1 Tax=Maudiozyma saulgeensis TaxID=1789683 RepID=A0A1X7RB79_9SACH|nr:similar to Saccharomyces cerevisiae YPR189W SKI3 Ski complex component and TPR protein, mediates 3'-5' RNA degradation by the cytoplasmic exosome [Kazachstania saulgeensis]